MQKYFLNEGTGQQGPFSLEELKDKNIHASTPIWYDGLEKWTTAGELPELSGIVIHTPPPFEAAKPPVVPTPVVPITETVITTTPATATASAATPVAAMKPAAAVKTTSGKKSTAWLSWALGIVALGGIGYYIYQDMEKNKDNKPDITVSMSSSDTATASTTPETTTTTPTTDATTPIDTAATTTTTTAEPDPSTTTTTTTPTEATTLPASNGNDKEKAAAKAKADAAAKAKADAVTKAKADAAARAKADDLKKKQQAAASAQAAKETMMRNQWPKYISIGTINYKTKDDGLDNFDIPVYNGTDAVIDRITLRVDYMKKEGKVIKSETIVVDGVPVRGGKNAKAPENKKARKVNVYITAISSRGLHFCYPVNNGNAADPYYCK